MLAKNRRKSVLQTLSPAFMHCLNIFFNFHQLTDCLDMARYVLIDVSFREAIQTNIECSKISPFVCGNISTYSVAKKY